MQNKSSLNINVGDHYSNLTRSLPDEEFSLENVPVHSMKKDLEMISNPALMHQYSSPPPISSNFNPASSPKISPFLERTTLASPISRPEKVPPSLVDEQPSALEETGSSKKFDLKKVFVFSTIFLSLIALGVGSYYFWLVRGKSSEVVTEEPEIASLLPAPVEEPSLPAAIVEPVVIPPEKPKENIITLSLENSTRLALKESLASQVKALADLPLITPVEIKVQDAKNNPIALQVFAEKTGITFIKDVSAYLGENFRLFVFSDGQQLGLGLVLESKNDTSLIKELLKKEPLLVENLDVLFLEKFTKPVKVSFNSSVYKDFSVRYFNIISQEKLSIDYTAAKNKLLIGTTRKTLAALGDWLLLQPATQ